MIKILPFSHPKKTKASHLMADYVELLCVRNIDHEISMDEALTRVYHSVESEAEREIETKEGLPAETAAEFKDRQREAAEDWFRHLRYRKEAFKDFYPFQLEDKRLILVSSLSEKMKIYVFLLLCSNLRIITNKERNVLTTDFEVLSLEALKRYLPEFTVHHFGKCQKAREHYPNKLVDAIETLASKLNERDICDKNGIGTSNTGDGGLDIVAWRSLSHDTAPGNLICFVQCTCSHGEWERKLYDAHLDKWRHYIDFIHFPVNFMFIPSCFRSSNGGWFSKDNIRSSIVIDRLRICLLFDNFVPTDFSQNDTIFQTVDGFLNLQEQLT
jgi:hypothetical protein